MEACETCGNRYEHTFTIRKNGSEHTFDCFESAMHALAPSCARCGVRVLGHGVAVDEVIYCSAHCGRMRGERDLCDHAYGSVDVSQ